MDEVEEARGNVFFERLRAVLEEHLKARPAVVPAATESEPVARGRFHVPLTSTSTRRAPFASRIEGRNASRRSSPALSAVA